MPLLSDPSFQGGVIEELLPPTEIMESLERIESLGERAAKVMLLFVEIAWLWLILVDNGRRSDRFGSEIGMDIEKEVPAFCFNICIGIEIA